MLCRCQNVEYQPLLACSMDRIGWGVYVDEIVETEWRMRSYMNLVSSLITDRTPVECREKLLGVEFLCPPPPLTDDISNVPDVASLSRLFKTTFLITDDIIRSWVVLEYWEMLVTLVVPAFVNFAKTLDTIPERVEEWRSQLLEKINAGIPDLESWAVWIPSTWWVGCCAECINFAEFLLARAKHEHDLEVREWEHYEAQFYIEFLINGPLKVIRVDKKQKKITKLNTRMDWRLKAMDQVDKLHALYSGDISDGGPSKRQRTE